MGAIITDFPQIQPVDDATDGPALEPYGYLGWYGYYVDKVQGVYYYISNYTGADIKGFLLNDPNLFKPYGGSQVAYVQAGICLLSDEAFVVNLALGPGTYRSIPDFQSGIISYGGNDYHGVVASTGVNGDVNLSQYTGIYNVEKFDTFEEGLIASGVSPIPPKYSITYSATNGTVTGPAEAEVGETVVATGTPNVNYGITDYTTQISITCNDIPVPFTFNTTTNQITFTMPDPTSG